MDMSKYRGMFLTEAGEHLKSMSRLLVALEKNPSERESIDTLFRNAHSVKGMAASMGYDNTARLAHSLEDLLDGFRKSGSVPPATVDRLLAGLDLLEGLLEDVAQERSEREVESFLGSPVEAEPAAMDPPPRPLLLPPPKKSLLRSRRRPLPPPVFRRMRLPKGDCSKSPSTSPPRRPLRRRAPS